MTKQKKLEKKVLKAAKYIKEGDPLKDVMDDWEISMAIELLAEYIDNEGNERCG